MSAAYEPDEVPAFTVFVFGAQFCDDPEGECERPARSWCPDCLVPLDACAKPDEHDEEAVACNEHRHRVAAMVRGERSPSAPRSTDA